MTRVEEKLDAQTENMATKDDIGKILNRLDSIEKKLELDDDERLVRGVN